MLIAFMVLGSVVARSQGFMFLSSDEVIKEVGTEHYTITDGTTEEGVSWMSLSDDDYEWVLFFGGDSPIVLESHLISKQLEAFKNSLSIIDSADMFVRQGDGNWIIMRSSYAIQVKTKMFDYSIYPVIIYTYVIY